MNVSQNTLRKYPAALPVAVFIQPQLDLLHLKHYYLWLPGKRLVWPFNVQSRPPSLRFTEIFTTPLYRSGRSVNPHVVTCLAENDSPRWLFIASQGNEQTQSGLSLPLLKKRKLYQVPTVRGQFALRIKAGVTALLGSRGRKIQKYK